MAGITPLVPPRTGAVNGKLDIKTDTHLTHDELLKFCPQFEPFLDEITKKGWRYLYIEGFATVVKQMIISSPYRFMVGEHPQGGLIYTMNIDFGRNIPDANLKELLNLDRFIINISSKDFPRAVTADLVKKEVIYVHESLWISEGKECKDEAGRVLEILRWLVDEKKFTIKTDDRNKYRELVATVGKK